jgi:hypothetical protein
MQVLVIASCSLAWAVFTPTGGCRGSGPQEGYCSRWEVGMHRVIVFSAGAAIILMLVIVMVAGMGNLITQSTFELLMTIWAVLWFGLLIYMMVTHIKVEFQHNKFFALLAIVYFVYYILYSIFFKGN